VNLIASVSKDNSVLVEGHFIGRIEGFSFINEVSKNAEDKKEVLKVVRRTLSKELKNRVEQSSKVMTKNKF
jgi:ATP-dependent RNA helicase SUPV3L1/SUV3